jgi:hypothetical protein
MDRDPFGHRKYHALYFILGILIAFIVVPMLTGCERGEDSKGRACTAVVGIGVTGDACEVIEEDVFVIITDDRACTGWNCNGPTDPPGCWYPGNTQYCDIERPRICCMALTPSCEACQEGLSVGEWLVETCGVNACDAEYAGWDEDNNEPIWLCQAVIIN